jgi:D-tyrosyl-tRNA(Tyr) deacylase
MRAVVQRIRDCSVNVGERKTGEIKSGLLVYLGVGRRDSPRDVQFLCEKVLNLRVFPDKAGKMNLSVRDIGGGIMVVSQFTLFGDAREGRRPSYTEAADPEKARELYRQALQLFLVSGIPVASGEFQASMEVSYTNMGPVTILLDSENRF